MGIDEYIRYEERERIVENLLKDSGLPVEKIASLVNVTVEFVDKVKAELKEA